jgi:hypothetical protein
MNDIADGDALKADRRAILEAGGILKVRAQQQLAGEGTTAGAGHEEDQPDQHCRSGQDQCAYSQLRPLYFLAAWHGILPVENEPVNG